MDLNAVSLTGRLTRDVESRYTTSGKQLATFGLAVNGFKQDDTVFVDVECWERTAETAREHLRKGSRIAIVGRLKLDQWTVADGFKRSKIGVVATQVIFLESKAKGNGFDYQPAGESQRDDDDTPF